MSGVLTSGAGDAGARAAPRVAVGAGLLAVGLAVAAVAWCGLGIVVVTLSPEVEGMDNPIGLGGALGEALRRFPADPVGSQSGQQRGSGPLPGREPSGRVRPPECCSSGSESRSWVLAHYVIENLSVAHQNGTTPPHPVTVPGLSCHSR